MTDLDCRYVWELLESQDPHWLEQYGTLINPLLVGMVHSPPQLILDVGCGVGGYGAFFKEQFPACRVVGVEPNPHLVALAAPRLDHLLCSRLEDADLAGGGIFPGSVDLILLTDVLEHMINPWKALQGLLPFLSPRGEVVASIPNVRNLAVIDALVRGEWSYEPYGILDITHLRFFTLAGVKRLFAETGFQIREIRFNMDSRCQGLMPLLERPMAGVRTDALEIRGMNQRDLVELATLQFFVRAERAPLSVPSAEGSR